MNTEKIKSIIRDTVKEVQSDDVARLGVPMLSIRDLASLTDISMSTLKNYEAAGIFETNETMGVKLIDIKAFRDWCLENMLARKKANVVGRLDAYMKQFQTQKS